MNSSAPQNSSTYSGGGGQPPPPSGHLTLRDLCCLFCCPPCPSNIVAKLAFMPPEPTYKIISDETGSKYTFALNERTEWPYPRDDFANLDVFYTHSARGNRVACMFVKCVPDARHTILFSHGNAVDLGQMSSFYYGLGHRLDCNVFSYDYSGYGGSSGKPTEKNLYADIRAAYTALLSRYQVSPDSVVLYGQSIGTVPTVDLASRVECAAVILHSPLMSGMRVAFPDTRRTWCFDAFPSIDKIVKVRSPTLVIHGTEDEVIDFSHGLSIYEKCPRAVEPLWVPGAGHNDVELHGAYLERLRQFIGTELDQPSSSSATGTHNSLNVLSTGGAIGVGTPSAVDSNANAVRSANNNNNNSNKNSKNNGSLIAATINGEPHSNPPSGGGTRKKHSSSNK